MVQARQDEIKYDGYDGFEAPDLYHATTVAKGIKGLDAVSDDQVRLFHEQGFLVVDDAFRADEVASAIDGLLHLIGGNVPEFRGIQFEAKARNRLDDYTADKKQDAVRKLAHFVEYDQRLKAMSENPRLLAVLERILDDSPEMFQDMALLKPPFIGREKPWHQDNAFFNLPVDKTVCGVWIALDDAIPENGCMHIIPGSHHRGPVVHFNRRDWQICDTDVAADEAVAVPLKPGGCLFFHGLMHHGTPPTTSALRRRALQFHYKPANLSWGTQEERLAVFGDEGKDVEC